MKTLSQQLLELKEEFDSVGTRLNGLTWQRIERHMKEFALEACKETLKNASENATLLIEVHETQSIRKGQLAYIADEHDHFEVDKQSILSETNIPKEVKI